MTFSLLHFVVLAASSAVHPVYNHCVYKHGTADQQHATHASTFTLHTGMGSAASTTAHTAELARLKSENDKLKRETNVQRSTLSKLMGEMSTIENKRSFLTKGKKIKRLEVSAEVIKKYGEDEKRVMEFKTKVVEKSENANALLSSAIGINILFREHPEEVRKGYVGAFTKEPTLKKGHVLISKGEELSAATKFYIVESGTLEVSIDGTIVGEVNAGQGVGELALLHNQPRLADVVAKVDTVLWSLSRDMYHEINYCLRVQKIMKIQKYLTTVDLLKVLSKSE